MHDGAMLELPRTVEKVAQQLRLHVHTQDGYFVETEVDYAAAAKVIEAEELGLPPEPIGESAAPREGRAIYDSDLTDNATSPPSKYDERYLASTTVVPGAPVGLIEHTGSGTLIGGGFLITAGHVLYETDSNKWYCRNQSLSNSTNPCDGSGEAGDSRWIFKATGRSNCAMNSTVNGAWVAMVSTDSGSKKASADYAVVEFVNCPNVTSNGSVGYRASSASTGQVLGYPGLYHCPAGHRGDPGSDCPLSGGQGVWQLTGTPPVTGGKLYVSGASSFVVGDSPYEAETWKFLGDWTAGESGGPLVRFMTPPGESANWYATGIVSRSSASTNGLSTNTLKSFSTAVRTFLTSAGVP